MRRGWLGVWAVFVVAQLWILYTPDVGSGPGALSPVWDVLRPLPGPTAPDEPGFDKVVHATIFAAVTATGLLAGWPKWFAIGFPLLHAPVSEVIQGAWISGRGAEWGDLFADWTGVLVAVLLFGRRRRPEPSSASSRGRRSWSRDPG